MTEGRTRNRNATVAHTGRLGLGIDRDERRQDDRRNGRNDKDTKRKTRQGERQRQEEVKQMLREQEPDRSRSNKEEETVKKDNRGKERTHLDGNVAGGAGHRRGEGSRR